MVTNFLPFRSATPSLRLQETHQGLIQQLTGAGSLTGEPSTFSLTIPAIADLRPKNFIMQNFYAGVASLRRYRMGSDH